MGKLNNFYNESLYSNNINEYRTKLAEKKSFLLIAKEKVRTIEQLLKTEYYEKLISSQSAITEIENSSKQTKNPEQIKELQDKKKELNEFIATLDNVFYHSVNRWQKFKKNIEETENEIREIIEQRRSTYSDSSNVKPGT